MNRKFLLLLTLLACGATTDAMAATITAKAEDHTITVFSTSDKPERCSAIVHFTFMQDGKRTPGFTSQAGFTTVPGKNVKVWKFTNPGLIGPVIFGAINVQCGDTTPKK